MKCLILITAAFSILVLSSCSSSLPEKVQQARTHLRNNNPIGCIDTLTLALPHWKDKDGLALRGEGYQLLGQAYHQLGQIDKAIEAYRIAVKSSSTTFPSALALGLIYLTANQHQKSLEAYAEALRMKPDDPSALIGMGNAYFGMQKFVQAKEQYQRVIDTAPGVRDALHFIALTNSKISTSPRKKAAPSKSNRRKRRQ